MDIRIYRRHESSKAVGVCVVIDVLRAFTTAAYAFAAGAKEIVMVSTTEEAFGMHQKDDSLLLMGEHGGRPIEGFHYGNSPVCMKPESVNGRRIVQRTSSGTQGVVNCIHATHLMISSFVVANATIKRICQLKPAHLSLIVTGEPDGDEDMALAEYIQAKIQGHEVSPEPYLKRVSESTDGKNYANAIYPDFLPEDLECALKLDLFSFAMEVERRNDELIAHALSTL